MTIDCKHYHLLVDEIKINSDDDNHRCTHCQFHFSFYTDEEAVDAPKDGAPKGFSRISSSGSITVDDKDILHHIVDKDRHDQRDHNDDKADKDPLGHRVDKDRQDQRVHNDDKIDKEPLGHKVDKDRQDQKDHNDDKVEKDSLAHRADKDRHDQRDHNYDKADKDPLSHRVDKDRQAQRDHNDDLIDKVRKEDHESVGAGGDCVGAHNVKCESDVKTQPKLQQNDNINLAGEKSNSGISKLVATKAICAENAPLTTTMTTTIPMSSMKTTTSTKATHSMTKISAETVFSETKSSSEPITSEIASNNVVGDNRLESESSPKQTSSQTRSDTKPVSKLTSHGLESRLGTEISPTTDNTTAAQQVE